MRLVAITLLWTILCVLWMPVFAQGQPASSPSPEGRKTAIFAGGCFWCMEHPFDRLEGVISTITGYTGGNVEDPTYEQVSQGGTGHREAVKVIYNPEEVDYATLLKVFWRNVDPFDAGGQFCDRGKQYTTAIFVADAEQRQQAERSKQAVQERLGEEVVTPILPADPFYRAEAYHQDYYRENSLRYKFYRWSCGRDERLKEVWGDQAGGH